MDHGKHKNVVATLLYVGAKNPLTFIQCSKSESDYPMKEHIDELSRPGDNTGCGRRNENFFKAEFRDLILFVP
jgi:hypothetical protein